MCKHRIELITKKGILLLQIPLTEFDQGLWINLEERKIYRYYPGNPHRKAYLFDQETNKQIYDFSFY